MSNVKKIRLPHGKVSAESVIEPHAREAIRRLSDNIERLADALSDAVNRLEALERGG